jgi:hypothetical protein
MINLVKNYRSLEQIRHVKLKLLLTLCNTLILIILTVFLQNIGLIRFDETAFFKAFAITKHNILGIDKKPVADSVIFLDVSKDLELVDDTALNYGKVVIKDRSILASFFSTLNQHPSDYKYVLCDISFDYPSPDDSLLRREIERAPNLIIAATLNDNKVREPIFNVQHACVDYVVNKSSFVKMPLFYDDTIKSLPLTLVEKTTSKRYSHKNGVTYENNKPTFNTVIPEFYYRPKDLKNSIRTNESNKANLYYIGNFLEIPNYFRLLKDKYIIIGDFTSDIHSTYLGDMPGSLILFDTYLTIRSKSINISASWLLLLFIIYLIISYFIFIRSALRFEQLQKKIKIRFFKSFVKKYLSYLGILIGLNLLSYAFFGVFISLFFLATYLTLLQLAIEKRRLYLKSKNLITFIKEEVT